MTVTTDQTQTDSVIHTLIAKGMTDEIRDLATDKSLDNSQHEIVKTFVNKGGINRPSNHDSGIDPEIFKPKPFKK